MAKRARSEQEEGEEHEVESVASVTRSKPWPLSELQPCTTYWDWMTSAFGLRLAAVLPHTPLIRMLAVSTASTGIPSQEHWHIAPPGFEAVSRDPDGKLATIRSRWTKQVTVEAYNTLRATVQKGYRHRIGTSGIFLYLTDLLVDGDYLRRVHGSIKLQAGQPQDTPPLQALERKVTTLIERGQYTPAIAAASEAGNLASFPAEHHDNIVAALDGDDAINGLDQLGRTLRSTPALRRFADTCSTIMGALLQGATLEDKFAALRRRRDTGATETELEQFSTALGVPLFASPTTLKDRYTAEGLTLQVKAYSDLVAGELVVMTKRAYTGTQFYRQLAESSLQCVLVPSPNVSLFNKQVTKKETVLRNEVSLDRLGFTTVDAGSVLDLRAATIVAKPAASMPVTETGASAEEEEEDEIVDL